MVVDLLLGLSTSHRWNHIHMWGFGFFVRVLHSSTLLWAVNVCSFYCHIVNMPYVFKENLFSCGHFGHLQFGAVNKDCCGCFCPCLLVDRSSHFSWVCTWARNCFVIKYASLGFVMPVSLPIRLYLFYEQCMGGFYLPYPQKLGIFSPFNFSHSWLGWGQS